jgi:hypothetical protein
MALLEAQEQTRIPWLIPERHRRMAASAFAFFRGSPVVMASDLGRAPHSGLEVQLCGDAHLLNFGFYASPERALLFDINDFDETVRGPFEWDLQRLVCSLVIAAQFLHLSAAWQERVARHGARAYRKEMQRLADRSRIDVWYRRIDVDALIAELPERPFRAHLQQVAAQARQRDSRQAVRRLCTTAADGQLQIRHAPPLIWRHAEMDAEPGLDRAPAAAGGAHLCGLSGECAAGAAALPQWLSACGHGQQGGGRGLGRHPLLHRPAGGVPRG